jgi:hypothetical protein
MYGTFTVDWVSVLLGWIYFLKILALVMGIEYLLFYRRIHRRLNMLEKRISLVSSDFNDRDHVVNNSIE